MFHPISLVPVPARSVAPPSLQARLQMRRFHRWQATNVRDLEAFHLPLIEPPSALCASEYVPFDPTVRKSKHILRPQITSTLAPWPALNNDA